MEWLGLGTAKHQKTPLHTLFPLNQPQPPHPPPHPPPENKPPPPAPPTLHHPRHPPRPPFPKTLKHDPPRAIGAPIRHMRSLIGNTQRQRKKRLTVLLPNTTPKILNETTRLIRYLPQIDVRARSQGTRGMQRLKYRQKPSNHTTHGTNNPNGHTTPRRPATPQKALPAAPAGARPKRHTQQSPPSQLPSLENVL